MEQRKNPRKKIKVEVRSSPLSLKILLTLLIIFSIAALTALRWVHLDLQAQTQELVDEAAAVGYANEQLEDKIDNLGSIQSIEEIAKEELDLVHPNTVIVKPN